MNGDGKCMVMMSVTCYLTVIVVSKHSSLDVFSDSNVHVKQNIKDIKNINRTIL